MSTTRSKYETFFVALVNGRLKPHPLKRADVQRFFGGGAPLVLVPAVEVALLSMAAEWYALMVWYAWRNCLNDISRMDSVFGADFAPSAATCNRQ